MGGNRAPALDGWTRAVVMGKLRSALSGEVPLKLTHHDGRMTTVFLDRMNTAGALPIAEEGQRAGLWLWLMDHLSQAAIAQELRVSVDVVRHDREAAMRDLAPRIVDDGFGD